MKFGIGVFLLILSLSYPIYAAENIVDVDFQGLKSVTETQVRSQILSIEGTPLSRRQLGRDIKKLYQTGLFSDVQVDKTAVAGGVRLLFIVQEKSVVAKLTIQGNKKIKDDDIEKALQIREFENFDLAKIAESKKKILDLYEEKGYYFADVETLTEPFDEDKNQIEVVFKIREGKRVQIRRIKFLGNKAFSDKELRKKMRTKEKGFFSFMNKSGQLKIDALEIDRKLLAYHYQDFGYLDVKIGEPSITLTRNKKAIYITIPVEEGQQYKVESVDVLGDILTTEQELKDHLKQTPGEIYKKSREYEDRQSLERLYGDQAYIFANIQPQNQLFPDSKLVKVTYFVRKGAKIKIDKILIKGNKITRDKVIRRELRVFENSYFSQSGLERSRVRLMQLGYFEDVKFSTPRSTDPDKVNIVIEVIERNTGEVNVGGGFSTLESFIFTARIRKDNFLGYGWNTSLQTMISKLQQSFQFYFQDLYFLDTKWSLSLQGERIVSSINPSFDQNQLGASIGFGREIFDFFRVNLRYRYSDIEISNFAAQVPQFFIESADGVVSSATTTFSYDRRNSRIQPTKGTYTALSYEYAGSFMGTDHPFQEVSLDNRFYIQLPLKLIFRGRQLVQYVDSLTNEPVRLFNRYYLGGPNSLRGFGLRTVGPTLDIPTSAKGADTLYPYGGNKALQFNWELEIPIYADAGFYGVAFIDSGNAFSENQDYSLTDLRHNYGFGIRWQSPIGPLRFEWGFPINKQSGDDGAVFNFMIGPNF